VAQLVQQRGLSRDDLRRLRQVVDEQLASKHPGTRTNSKSGDRK
jgi:hypothetical protein